jgi:hypothetical protein
MRPCPPGPDSVEPQAEAPGAPRPLAGTPPGTRGFAAEEALEKKVIVADDLVAELEKKIMVVDDLTLELKASKMRLDAGIERIARIERDVKTQVRIHDADFDLTNKRIKQVQEQERDSHSHRVGEINHCIKRIRRLERTACLDSDIDEDDEQSQGH